MLAEPGYHNCDYPLSAGHAWRTLAAAHGLRSLDLEANRWDGSPNANGILKRIAAMSMQGRIGRNAGAKVKRALGVQMALEWAFRVEQAQLELPPPKDVAKEDFGLEYVLLQRAALGCKVDGGQHKMGSYTHPDAEVIAATVAGMPDSLGGIRMAISVAEMARAGITPNWMPGAVPRCVPVDMKRNRHGDRAVSVVVGAEKVLVSGKWRTIEMRACPVTWRPHPEQMMPKLTPWV
jgi:hypothetical protein